MARMIELGLKGIAKVNGADVERQGNQRAILTGQNVELVQGFDAKEPESAPTQAVDIGEPGI